ncbi:MAG: hypothetical protein HN348_12810 [Proteobacteria bacterium]|jgi:nickel/cobalt transporter (NicO) family protein|nr:hypothetical protein [Pseudomonadota bacterium]
MHRLFPLIALVVPNIVQAHPMGTMSINRSALVQLYPDETSVLYAVDFAEVPSTAENRRAESLGVDEYAAARIDELLKGIVMQFGDQEVPLTVGGCTASITPGEGDLPIVGLLCTLHADAAPLGPIVIEDHNFSKIVGWRELAFVGEGVDVGEAEPPLALRDSAVPFATFPENMTLSSARAVVGVAGAPLASSEKPAEAESTAMTKLITGDLSLRFALLALITAVFLGAGHALAPGHGKTIVAAYLVGTRGTVMQALLLGLTVTITHISSVLILGVVTLVLSEYVVASQLYPWIGVGSGLGVVAVGAGLLRSRLQHRHAHTHGGHTHIHGHDHDHDHDQNDPQGHDHHHGADGHTHVHLDESGEPVSLGQLLVLGITGGAVPCPSALVVLLAAIALHRIWFGLFLIVAFSLGLASVLIIIGVLVVRAQNLLDRFSRSGRSITWLPVASAIVVIVLGVGIALQSAREGGLL